MGHGLTMEQKEEVERVAAQLASMSSSSIDLKGTSWATIYTNASGGSSGKIGPFVSEVTQVFDVPSRVEDPPRYCNKALFYGALALKLEGKYKISEARIDLEFTRSSLELFGKEIYSKAFTPGEMQGFWKVQYADEEIRVFTTNRGSLFVLARLDSERLL